MTPQRKPETTSTNRPRPADDAALQRAVTVMRGYSVPAQPPQPPLSPSPDAMIAEINTITYWADRERAVYAAARTIGVSVTTVREQLRLHTKRAALGVA